MTSLPRLFMSYRFSSHMLVIVHNQQWMSTISALPVIRLRVTAGIGITVLSTRTGVNTPFKLCRLIFVHPLDSVPKQRVSPEITDSIRIPGVVFQQALCMVRDFTGCAYFLHPCYYSRFRLAYQFCARRHPNVSCNVRTLPLSNPRVLVRSITCNTHMQAQPFFFTVSHALRRANLDTKQPH